jgi:flagellum-specific peptidoglycan hydrolase FlgJ
LIAGVAHVYATSPNYTRLVTAIAHQSNLAAAIQKAKAAA